MFFDADFVTIATAAPGGAGGIGGLVIQLAPFLLIFVVFYFLLIRPQQQRMKKHREMVENLRRGDEVVTAGGMIGKVTRIAETEVTVELAEGVRVKVIKHTISEVRARTEPSKPAAANEDEDERA
ncbi:preprotein translocase subunit YajC [Marinicauda pacifica]|jgi:preprotein translocase subunit YajC|uniref:Sec translocon accessory complex subunit YajC n=1 Tax=Marinicauda pacifica TaxID=1133559 RepID=A0A4S2HDY7_9PROT|nr:MULTISPECIES: preprotein translocase subunit YajC [Marinicauda]TGY94224.1 preprotein translocase subunit YajC [Marinicauda pacifica]GGE33968.1 preprotein translocase subunit YajC [Marinicauda pacifica]